jgi:hypothetical protein
MCPTDSYVTAMQARYEIGDHRDETALNGVMIRCRKKDYTQKVDKLVYGG